MRFVFKIVNDSIKNRLAKLWLKGAHVIDHLVDGLPSNFWRYRYNLGCKIALSIVIKKSNDWPYGVC